jgi:hypothetical protein
MLCDQTPAVFCARKKPFPERFAREAISDYCLDCIHDFILEAHKYFSGKRKTGNGIKGAP